MRTESGAYEGQYTFTTRFGQERGTNPEELLAAAHAGCFSMSFAARCVKNNFTVNSIETKASLTVEKKEEGFRVTTIVLDCVADVPDISDEQLNELALDAKVNCPVSAALSSADITLNLTRA